MVSPRIAAILCMTLIEAVGETSLFAAQPVVFTLKQAAAMVVYAPKPNYPEPARRHRQMGKGVFVLNVNVNTGRVTSIKIEQRIGYQILDNACLRTLINWQFKPNTVAKVRIPVTFVIGGYRTTELEELFP